ncbi:MAG: hypothetical protein GY714_05445 [Desulfobacterales bacterium]|nr:hypothetical protein [Desulfobacterales bacterium]
MELEIKKTKKYLNEVGVFSKVPVIIESINIIDNNITLKLTLKYLKKHPVCCGEPGCYIPFLRTNGLKKLAELYQKENEFRSIPKLTIEVSCIFEPGFKFLEEGLGEAKNWSTIYNYYPEK